MYRWCFKETQWSAMTSANLDSSKSKSSEQISQHTPGTVPEVPVNNNQNTS